MAVQKRDQIYVELDLPYAELKFLTKAVESPAEFFHGALAKWDDINRDSESGKSSATIEKLVQKLRNLNLFSSTGKREYLYKN